MSLRNLIFLLLLLMMIMVSVHQAESITFSSRLFHRFSDKMKALRVSKSANSSLRVLWPEKGSMEYYQELVSGDFQRKKLKLGYWFQLLFPSEGSKTIALGNDFGWCSCSLMFGAFIMQDKDLNEYRPSRSSSSKHISFSHNLCESGQSCQSPKQSCPYVIDYTTENTSSSGLLIQDVLHLSSSCEKSSNCTIQAPIILGEAYIDRRGGSMLYRKFMPQANKF